MSNWKRSLLLNGMPELPPEAFKHNGLGKITFEGGDPPPPTSTQTSYAASLQPELMPYGQDIAKKAQTLSGANYTPYQGQRIADFSPMQQQAFQNIGEMQTNQATGAGIGIAAQNAQQAAQYGNYQPQQFGNQYQGQNFNNMGLSYQATQNPNLQNFQMRGPQNVASERVGTQNFNDPATAQSYMNPYTQNVVDYQKSQALRDYQIAQPMMNKQAVASGAFGGSRQAILQAEAQKNLNSQLQGIEATGAQSAYNQAQQAFQTDQARQLQAQQANQQTGLQAGMSNQQMGYNIGNTNLQSLLGVQQLGSGQDMQSQLANQQTYGQMQGLGMQQNLAGNAQAMQNAQLAAQYGLAGQQAGEQSRQFGSNLGLQGLQQQLAAAGQLGQLGQQQYTQQMGINAAQQQVGAQQQAGEQAGMTQQYQDFLKQQEYPYSQLAFYNSMIRGLSPVMPTTTSTYAPAPSGAAQLAGLGLGAYSVGKLASAI